MNYQTIIQSSCCDQTLFTFTLQDCAKCGKPPTDIKFHESNVAPCKPRSLVIKPTFCNFSNYSSNALLHCGISNSKGLVYNFDSRGVSLDQPWSEVINVMLKTDNYSDEQWDRYLQEHYENEKILEKKNKYNQFDNNCYDYVLRFFNTIKYDGKNNHTKADIVINIISGAVDSWDSVHNIYSKISQFGVYKLDPNTITNCSQCKETDLKPNNRFHCLTCNGKALCSKCKDGHPKHKFFPIVPNIAYQCDGCSGIIIEGPIYRCATCKEDYDLCPDCNKKKIVTGPHQKTHDMVKIFLPIRINKK